jgi:hypothetical protein
MSQLTVSRLSRQCGIFNIWQPYRPPWPVTRIYLLYWSDGSRFHKDAINFICSSQSADKLSAGFEVLVAIRVCRRAIGEEPITFPQARNGEIYVSYEKLYSFSWNLILCIMFFLLSILPALSDTLCILLLNLPQVSSINRKACRREICVPHYGADTIHSNPHLHRTFRVCSKQPLNNPPSLFGELVT